MRVCAFTFHNVLVGLSVNYVPQLAFRNRFSEVEQLILCKANLDELNSQLETWVDNRKRVFAMFRLYLLVIEILMTHPFVAWIYSTLSLFPFQIRFFVSFCLRLYSSFISSFPRFTCSEYRVPLTFTVLPQSYKQKSYYQTYAQFDSRSTISMSLSWQVIQMEVAVVIENQFENLSKMHEPQSPMWSIAADETSWSSWS